MNIPISKVPQKRGFYFVKSNTSKVWQIIVQICGFAPFFYFESVNTLFKESDAEILSDLRDLVWSEEIEIEAEEIWYGYKISNETKNEAIALIKDGSKLAAVKLVKFSTKNPDDDEAPCLGLREAKEYVDMLQEKIKAEQNQAVCVAN